MAQILSGLEAASALKEKLKLRLAKLNPSRPPHLVAVLVGNHAPSLRYVSFKKRAAEEIGFKSTILNLSKEISFSELSAKLKALSADNEVDGIILQMPIPSHLDPKKLILKIAPEKDVDGFHPENVGKLSLLDDGLIAATPLGILRLFEHYNLSLEGKKVLILGRSSIVGRPLSILLSQDRPFCNATVTLAHSRSQNLPSLLLSHEVIISAIGSPKLIHGDSLTQGVIVIDVGINITPAGKLVGDVDFESAHQKASFITPVPGGVGPMTIAALLENTLTAFERRICR